MMHTLSDHRGYWQSWLAGAAAGRVRKESARSLALFRAQGEAIEVFFDVVLARGLVGAEEQEILMRAFDDWDGSPLVTRLAVLSCFRDLVGLILEGDHDDGAAILEDFTQLLNRPIAESHPAGDAQMH